MTQINHDDIFKVLAAEYDLPYKVVKVMCQMPFNFARAKMATDEDIKPLMFAYLFKLIPKSSYIVSIENDRAEERSEGGQDTV